MSPTEVPMIAWIFALVVHLIIGFFTTLSTRMDIKEQNMFKPYGITNPQTQSRLRKIVFVLGWIPLVNVTMLALMLILSAISIVQYLLRYLKKSATEIFNS